MMSMTRTNESTATGCLLVAFELSAEKWKVGFGVVGGGRPWIRSLTAGDVGRLGDEITRAKGRFGLPADAAVRSCYEAGRDGFWLHRYLEAQGIVNVVVDSSSIEVKRRARRAKSDGLDVVGLLGLLQRAVGGEGRMWQVVRVPTVAEEDARHLHRLRETLQQERTRQINRLHGLLAIHGIRLPVQRDFLDRLAAARGGDGTPVPAGLRYRVEQGWAQLRFLDQQLAAVDAARADLVADAATETGRCVQALQRLDGMGPNGAWTLATEIFGWRQIRNRRELGALVGVVPTPYQSGAVAHEQGISRAGNRHVRRMIVQLAWSWLRYQKLSALSQWYQARFGQGRRARRVGIVALARKLLIAWWQYLKTGVAPVGATLKPHVA